MVSQTEFINRHVVFNDMFNHYSVFGKYFRRRGQAVKYASKLWRNRHLI